MTTSGTVGDAELEAAIAAWDWATVEDLTFRIAGKLATLAETDPAAALAAGQEVVLRLRSAHRLHDAAALADRLVELGHEPPPLVVHALALCLLDLGRGTERAAELVREALERPGLTAKEKEELFGALGRIQKVRYLDGGRPADLVSAIRYYHRGYVELPKSTFLAVNVAALLTLATRLGVDDAALGAALAGRSDPRGRALEVADAVVKGLVGDGPIPDGLEHWDYATGLECSLVLGRTELVDDWLQKFLDIATMDGVNSLQRQFEGIWRQDPPDALVTRVLDRLRSRRKEAHDTWVLTPGQASPEVVLRLPDGELRHAVVVDDLELLDPRRADGLVGPVLVTTGDVAWRESVECHVAGPAGEPVVIDVPDALCWASSPWLLDVTVIALRRTDLRDLAQLALRPAAAGKQSVAARWTVRVPQAGAVPAAMEPLRSVGLRLPRWDDWYLRYRVAEDTDAAPGAALLDAQGEVVGIQRGPARHPVEGTNERFEVEAVRWDAVVAMIGRAGLVTHPPAQ